MMPLFRFSAPRHFDTPLFAIADSAIRRFADTLQDAAFAS